ncbi:MAG: hypothetical protein H7Y08_01830 [Rhizobiaceae bacterium]|nr:hypothetical protein [Rhizobiaceae bacterium]
MARIFARFTRDKAANITIMFAFLIIPIIGATALAVDFGRTLTVNRQLSAAVDIAAVGAIAEKSPGAVAAFAMKGNGPIPTAIKDAEGLILANLPKGVDKDDVSLTIDVTKTGNNLKSTIAYAASVPTTLAQVFGYTTFPVEGEVIAEHQIAKFMDFFILIDNSPSMGVGATTTDIATMEKNTPDKCAFACHQLNDPKNYYALAKSLGVSMRIDVVRKATQELTKTAGATQQVVGQYKMGVYTFGAKAENAALTTISTPIEDLVKVGQYTDAVDLMTTPSKNYNNDQQTNFDAIFGAINGLIDTPGDGSSESSREKILFFVSDGVGDAYKPYNCTKKKSGNRCQEPIDTSLCQPLKDRGVKIAVLYTTYLPLPKNGWYNTWIKPFQPEIPSRMAACATPGLYYEVSANGGIVEAMNALFVKTIRTVKLSK